MQWWKPITAVLFYVHLRLITGDGGRSGQARGQHPARLFLSNISTVRHWNLPPGAAAIRAVGAVALATIPPPYDSILLKTVYHNADTGLIDFFPCKLVPDGARMPRYADDQQHDSPLRGREVRRRPAERFCFDHMPTVSRILLRSYAYGLIDITIIMLFLVMRQLPRAKFCPMACPSLQELRNQTMNSANFRSANRRDRLVLRNHDHGQCSAGEILLSCIFHNHNLDLYILS
jgi:hypothetical protein